MLFKKSEKLHWRDNNNMFKVFVSGYSQLPANKIKYKRYIKKKSTNVIAVKNKSLYKNCRRVFFFNDSTHNLEVCLRPL